MSLCTGCLGGCLVVQSKFPINKDTDLCRFHFNGKQVPRSVVSEVALSEHRV